QKKTSPPVSITSTMALLQRPAPYLHFYFRLMASRSRLFSHSLCPSLHRHSSSLSSSTPRFQLLPSFTSPSWFPVKLGQIKFQLAKVLSQRLVIRNAVSPRSFMSSTMDTDALHESSTSKDYSSEHIQVLEGLDPVRKRPGMYIGSTGSRGLHHLVYEILDNAIDEAQAGFASKIDVVLHADGSVSISDDGRGIPTDLHPATRKSSLETVLTRFSFGFRIKFQLAKVLSQRLVIRNAVSPRSFMSSTMDTDALHESSTSKDYSSEHIQVLEGLDPVRKRPGMYIGSTGSRGLHHLVYEILDNAIDEAQAGFASKIDVVLHADGSVSISDDGRGIPTDLHPATRKSSLETVLTVLHAGGKFGGKSSGYSVSGGLHGVGLSVVNALSEALEVIVRRDGMEFQHKYSRGKPITTLTCHVLPPESRGTQGTCIRFWPDKEVFTTAIQFDHNTIAGRIRELAFLNPKVTISLKKEDDDPERDLYSEYFYAGGLTEYVSWLNTDKKPLHDVLGFRKEINGTTVDVALQWLTGFIVCSVNWTSVDVLCSDAYSDTMLGYANSIRTIDGGTHIEGVKASLTRTLNSLAKKLKVIKEKDISLSGEHVREGLTCIVSVKVPDPEFEGQTKTRLGNPEVRKIVDQSLQEYLTEYLELHPDVLESIISKSLNAYKAALAAKRARELVRSKSILKSSSLPGKLADCSSTDPAESEIFIVEGDSAGGSAKQGRDRRFQAILPLRGKILNIERKDEAAMYKNEEIQNLILGLGLGVKGEDFNMENLRYHKIIILTDADVDGAHIRTLLLTFFFRYQRALFDAGCIYVGVPPLFKVERGKQAHYCYDEAALKQVIASFPGNASYNIQRFKGLGEMMPEQLWETTMNPDTRILKQLVVDDAAETNVVFSSLMGARVDVRKELIKSAATRMNLENLDI
ncbi:hypothetical protein DY000_02051012, partial [Brassica cretica]